jgi:hypothetical protein
MTAKRILWICYLVASVLLGVGAGQWFFRLFDQVVPPAVVTSFNRVTAHGYFLTNGAFLGVVIALWGALGYVIGRMQGRSSPAPAPPPPTVP